MSQFYQHYTPHQHPTSATASGHHGGRNRRQPRVPVFQSQSQKQSRGARSMKEMLPSESMAVTSFRRTFELGRSFDLDDDSQFVPNLLTESEREDSGSERSSLASNSPSGSPTQHLQQVVSPYASSYILNSNSPAFLPPSYNQHSSMKIHQPAASRARNAIPIINPANGQGLTVPSPPTSVSPAARMQQQRLRQW